jgi:hypothetical protein
MDRQPVFRDELNGLVERLERAIEKGNERTEGAIAKSEVAWRERTHELANFLHAQQVAAALLAQKVAEIERAAEADRLDRRRLWGRVVTVTGMVAALVAWVFDKLQAWGAHRP